MANGTGNGDLLLTALKMLGEMRLEFKRRAIESKLLEERMAKVEARMAKEKAEHDARMAQHEARMAQHEERLAKQKAEHEARMARQATQHDAWLAAEEKRAKAAELELTTAMRDLALLIQTVAKEVQGLKGRVTRLERDPG